MVGVQRHVYKHFKEEARQDGRRGPPQAVTFKRVKGISKLITFYLEELPGGPPNSSVPLLVRVRMANFDVHRVLVDEGSSVNVMYNHLF